MNGVAVAPWMLEAIVKEVEAWPARHSHACIESAVEDYRLLMVRNRELEGRMSRLRGDCQKLKGEKTDLLEKLSEMHADAQARRELIQLQARMDEAQARITRLDQEAGSLHRNLGSVTIERDQLRVLSRSQQTELEELKQALATLEVEHSDLQEALEGEKSARIAATHELQERLDTKEQAERRAETLQAENYQLEARLVRLMDEQAQQQDAVRKEFENLKRMRQQLEVAQEAARESQSGEKPVERRGPGFRLGSFMGGFLQGAADKIGHAAHPPRPSFGAESAHSTPRTSHSEALPPPEAVKAIYPERVLMHHEKVHSGGLGCTSIVFSLSGTQAASAGSDGVVRVWGAHDGVLVTELSGGPSQQRAAVNDVCFELEGTAILSAGADKCVRLWDLNTGRTKHTLTGHTGPVTCVTQHPFSSKVAASCSEDRTIKVWALDTGFCRRSILCASRPLGLTFTSDGSLLVSGHYDGAMRVWDASTGSLVQEIKQVHTQAMTAVCPTPNAHRVLGCGRDSVVSVVDVSRFQVKRRFSDVEHFQVGQSRCTPCASADDLLIAVGSSTGMVLLVDMQTGTIREKLSAHKAPVTGVAWNTRAEDWAVCAASADRSGDVVFWASSEGRNNSW